jgi:hypothetical protein
VDYNDFNVDQIGKERLKREEGKRCWITIHHILSKFELIKEDVKSRSVKML